MANKVERDYDRIINGLKNLEKAIEETQKQIEILDKSAAGAEFYMQDPVGMQNTKKLQELTAKMLRTVDTGAERVRERLRQAEQEKRAYESLMDQER